MSRAGLVSRVLFFVTCIGLAASAPLPARLSSLSNHHGEYEANLFARSLELLDGREFEKSDPEYYKREYLSGIDDEYMKREYDLSTFEDRDLKEFDYIKRDDSDVHMLYRRKSIFTKIRDGFRKFGHAIKTGFQKFGHAIKTGFQKAGHAIKTGFQKVGKVLKKGFQKVGKFFKTVGAKIVKFGLKVVAAIDSVASKVVKYIIPGVGQVLSKGLKAASKVADTISDGIHVSLGKKLDKGMNVMNHVINPFESLKGKAGKAAGIISSVLL